MSKRTIAALSLILLASGPALADDDKASGLPTGKRQHKPVKAAEPDTEQAMNKAELTEAIAKKTGVDKDEAEEKTVTKKKAKKKTKKK